MFTARMLVILQPPLTIPEAVDTIARAHTNAARPAMIRFALPHTMQGFLENLPDGVEPLFFDSALGLAGALPCMTDETHFLSVTGAHAFEQRWDNRLYALLKNHDKRTLLTAYLSPAPLPEPAPADAPTIRISKISGSRLAALRHLKKGAPQQEAPVGSHPLRSFLTSLRQAVKENTSASQAHLPALKEVLPDGSATIGRGLALVCAREPVKTMVIHPAFLFGAVTFLLEAEDLSSDQLSLEAYLTGCNVLALHEPLAYPLHAQPSYTLRLPPAETLPGTVLARFEQLLGFHAGERRCAAKTAMGLFGHEDIYPQRMPAKLMVHHKTRSAYMHLLETHMPLMVSAYIDLPNPRVEAGYYLLRFVFLRRIQSLPLILFTGGTHERTLRSSFPNTQSYPDNTLLPRTLLQSGMSPAEHFARSKTLLMLKAAKRQVEFSHISWVDMDVLPHPVCAEAVPDFSPLMDDRIHMATVHGIPDPSFMVIPVDMLPAVAQMVKSITQLDAELKRGFSEPLLWERIFRQRPHWFCIHPMPRRRLLFLTAFDPQLLTRSVHSFLQELPTPIKPPQQKNKTHSSDEKETP